MNPDLFATSTTRADALRIGVGDADLRRQVSERQLVRLRRGRYLDTAAHDALTAEERHAVAVRAAVAAQGVDGVVSHVSAAVLHGLPVWGCGLDVVHLTKSRRNAGRRSRLLHVHTAPVSPDETLLVDGLRVTTPARTVFDLACAHRFEVGVVVADAALAAGLTSAERLLEVGERGRGRTGRRVAAQVMAFADARSESVGESRSRVAMHRARLPVPALQPEIRSAAGDLVGRPDFRWGRLLGEFDGAVKYGRLRRAGEAAGDAVVREKRREDALRDLGHDVIRWGWADLALPGALTERIRAAITRSERRQD